MSDTNEAIEYKLNSSWRNQMNPELKDALIKFIEAVSETSPAPIRLEKPRDSLIDQIRADRTEERLDDLMRRSAKRPH